MGWYTSINLPETTTLYSSITGRKKEKNVNKIESILKNIVKVATICEQRYLTDQGSSSGKGKMLLVSNTDFGHYLIKRTNDFASPHDDRC